jgi:hypothetical protein
MMNSSLLFLKPFVSSWHRLKHHAGRSVLRLKRHGLLIEAVGKGRRISACPELVERAVVPNFDCSLLK